MRWGSLCSMFFFIGLTATGNQTAAKALHLLGYSVKHYPLSLQDTQTYDVCTDTPVGMWFRQGLLPRTATYVLTVREDREAWLAACEVWFTPESVKSCSDFTLELRRYLYGTTVFERDRFSAAYDQHLKICEQSAQAVGIPLHYWDVVADPHWAFLCSLTGRSQPESPFPFTPKPPLAFWH